MSPRREAVPEEETRFEGTVERDVADDVGDDLDTFIEEVGEEDDDADDTDDTEDTSAAKPRAAAEVDNREMDATRLYLSEIGFSPLLTAEQEVTLARRALAGDGEARRVSYVLTDGGFGIGYVETAPEDQDRTSVSYGPGAGMMGELVAAWLGPDPELLEDDSLDPGQVVVFGDEVNDHEMLTWAGTGVAMGNAGEVTKSIADHVTASNDLDGVAAFLESALFS